MKSKSVGRVKVGPNLFQRGERFYLVANVKGRQVFEPLAAKNKTEAKALRDKRMSEIAAERRTKDGLDVEFITETGDEPWTFAQAASKFIEFERGPSGTLTERTV